LGGFWHWWLRLYSGCAAPTAVLLFHAVILFDINESVSFADGTFPFRLKFYGLFQKLNLGVQDFIVFSQFVALIAESLDVFERPATEHRNVRR